MRTIMGGMPLQVQRVHRDQELDNPACALLCRQLLMLGSMVLSVAVLSTLAFSQWTKVGTAYGGVISALAVSRGGSVLAATEGRSVFRSSDHADNWLNPSTGPSPDYVRAIAAVPSGLLFLAEDYPSSRLFVSSDDGFTWVPTTIPPGPPIWTLSADQNGNLLAGTSEGLHRSTDAGQTWVSLSTTSPGIAVQSIGCTRTGTLYVGLRSSPGGILSSTNGGQSWYPRNEGLYYNIQPGGDTLFDDISSLLTLPEGDVIAAGWNALYYLMAGTQGWQRAQISANGFMCLSRDSMGIIFAGSYNTGIYRSTDRGRTWTVSSTGMTDLTLTCLAADGHGHNYAGTRHAGVHRSSDAGNSWSQTNDGLNAVIPVSIAAASDSMLFMGVWDAGAYRSLDGGATWTRRSDGFDFSGIMGYMVFAFLQTSTGVLAGTVEGIFQSTDAGGYWNHVDSSGAVRCFARSRTGALFAGHDYGLSKSTDDGASWTVVLENWNSVRGAVGSPNGDIYAGVFYGGGVYRSTDDGSTWTHSDLGGVYNYVSSLSVDSSGAVIAGTRASSIARSTDNGTTWSVSAINAGNEVVSAVIATREGELYTSLPSSGAYMSTDHGETWNQYNNGLPSPAGGLALAPDGHLITVLSDGTNYRTSIPVTEVRNIAVAPRTSFCLIGNYPNPFNASTVIVYEVPHATHVDVTVFDILGRQVLKLLNEERQAGRYYVFVDASSLASGLYFYRMHAGPYVHTRCMILVR